MMRLFPTLPGTAYRFYIIERVASDDSTTIISRNLWYALMNNLCKMLTIFFLLIYKNFYFWDCFSPKKFEPHQRLNLIEKMFSTKWDWWNDFHLKTHFSWQTKIYSVDSSCTYTIYVFLKILFHFCISWEREKKENKSKPFGLLLFPNNG